MEAWLSFGEAAGEEEVVAALRGHAHGVDAHELGELVFRLRDGLELREVLVGVGVLRGDEGASLGAVGVFEPAVGVGDGDGGGGAGAGVGVCDGLTLDGGRRGKGDAVFAADLGLGLGLDLGGRLGGEQRGRDEQERTGGASLAVARRDKRHAEKGKTKGRRVRDGLFGRTES